MANRNPLVVSDGRISELPDADDLILGGGLVKASIDVGKTKTIPVGYQLIVYGSFDNAGTLVADGTMVIL